MSRWEGPLAVQVESDGMQWLFGPLPDMPAALRFVSEHVYDVDRYRHQYVGLLDPADADTTLNHARPTNDRQISLFDHPPREHREPLEAALRKAISAQHGEPGDGPYGDGLYAHLDIHRPWRVELRAEECWEGDCEHHDQDGCCPATKALLCRGCTPLYASGGEWDGSPYLECQVDWPCSPVLVMCASFKVPLIGKALR